MANDNKTEKATPKHRAESRKKGKSPKSTDLNAATVVAAGVAALIVVGPAIVAGAAGAMRGAFAQIADPSAVTSAAGLRGIFNSSMHVVAVAVAPVAATCVAAAIVVNLVQVGWHPSGRALAPDFRRISPLAGLKNLVGPRLLVETAKSLAKVSVVGAVAAMTLIPELTKLPASVGTPPGALSLLVASSITAVVIRAVAAYLVIGIVDAIYQRHRHEQGLKMSKQEVKDEARQHSLPPEVRSALRRRQIQAARKRMMAAVPSADVVVTNPTHFAVALVYDGSKQAPEVIAKGQDLVALQIRAIAEEHDVPVVADPPLARALHGAVEVGQVVPEELWQAVAQLLAFVYRLAGRRRVLS
jgi:flagellar biosynthetic protein FlhB